MVHFGSQVALDLAPVLGMSDICKIEGLEGPSSHDNDDRLSEHACDLLHREHRNDCRSQRTCEASERRLVEGSEVADQKRSESAELMKGGHCPPGPKPMR